MLVSGDLVGQELVVCQVLAQDLNITMQTVRSKIRGYSVLVATDAGAHDFARRIRLNRSVD